MAQNKDLVADAQTLLEENLSKKKSVESARRLAGRGVKRESEFCFVTDHSAVLRQRSHDAVTF